MTLPGPGVTWRPNALLACVAAWLCMTPISAYPAAFQDWEIGCDNARSCRAIGVSADRKAAGGFAAIDRGGSPDSEANLWIRLPASWAGAETLSVLVDDRPVSDRIGQVPPASRDPETDARSILFDQRQSRLLIEQMLNARQLSLRDDDGHDAVRVSLDDVREALRQMDATQGRTATVTALVEPGRKPASNMKSAPSIPTISLVRPPRDRHVDIELFPPIWAKVKHAVDLSCLNTEAREPAPTEIARKVAVLDDSHELVQIDCVGGAYNTAAVYFIVPDGDVDRASQVEFELVNSNTGTLRATVENRVVNGEFNPQTGEITFFAKARGSGDCGVYGAYGWTGSRFSLLSQQQMDLCDGVDSNAWPTYWRVQASELGGARP